MHDFKETYISYEEAKEAAEKTMANEGVDSKWYFDYEIFETSES